MGSQKRKMFEGKPYVFYSTHRKKSAANREARSQRGKGYLVRVTRWIGGWWAVWQKKK